MHTENELHDYLYRSGHNLSLTTIDYIRQSWINPSRLVGAHAQSNVVSFVPSRKLNGKTYSTESRSPEHSFLTLCEFDDDVICALDQPDPIQIQQTIKNGIKRWGGYTPDALILTRNGPKVVEVKASTEVDDFLVSKAEDWKRYESGEIVFEPARKAFAELGLEHVVYVYRVVSRQVV